MDNWLVAAAMRSSDPNCRQSADCRNLGSPEPEIFTRKRSVQNKFRSFFSASQILFSKTWQNMCFPKKSTSLSCFFDFSEVAFSTSEKLCLGIFFPLPLLLCSPARLFFLATFFLEIRLLGDGIYRLVQRFTVRRASNICQSKKPVHLHH